MKVRLLLFAGLREAVGRKELVLELPSETSIARVLEQAEREAPAIGRHLGTALVSLNRERAPLDAVVSDGDEIALLPPVSGGAERPWVQAAPLSMDALLAEVGGPEIGGIATFTGVVRNRSRGEAIEHLEYEAYEPMAESEMRRIASQVAERWPEVRIAMSHRVGRLEIGDAAVMIAAAAPHRADAFDACRYAIDTLKESVPIWKKEFAESGAYWVEENP
jgi:molybdopterin synthase catalytic subunit